MTYVRPIRFLDVGEVPDPFTFQVCDDDGDPVDMTGATVTANLRRMGNATIVNPTGSVLGSVLSVQFTATHFATAGEYLLTVTGVLGVLRVVQSVRIRVREVA